MAASGSSASASRPSVSTSGSSRSCTFCPTSSATASVVPSSRRFCRRSRCGRYATRSASTRKPRLRHRLHGSRRPPPRGPGHVHRLGPTSFQRPVCAFRDRAAFAGLQPGGHAESIGPVAASRRHPRRGLRRRPILRPPSSRSIGPSSATPTRPTIRTCGRPAGRASSIGRTTASQSATATAPKSDVSARWPSSTRPSRPRCWAIS